MPVTLTELPVSSRLHHYVRDGDFLDCYAAQGTIAPRPAAEIIVSFPYWAKALVWVRKIITAPFGLKQVVDDAPDFVGPFPVVEETENEIIAGFNDKHLDFRIAVLRHDGKLHLATWVHTHNFLGRCYLAVIMPFHILIAKDGVKRAINAA